MHSRSGVESPAAGRQQTQGGTASFRFPKFRRLLRHADFQQVYKFGKRQFTGNMTVFFLRRSREAPTQGLRIGLTVGKVLGNSVERNRIKRRMREAVRLSTQDWKAAVDIVFNPRRSVLELPMQQLAEEVGRGLKLAMQRARMSQISASTVPTDAT